MALGILVDCPIELINARKTGIELPYAKFESLSILSIKLLVTSRIDESCPKHRYLLPIIHVETCEIDKWRTFPDRVTV